MIDHRKISDDLLITEHFLQRAHDTGDWKDEHINAEQFLELLTQKINNVDFASIKDDVARFIPDDSKLKIWEPKYFHDLAEKLKFQEKTQP